ncbi:MAG: ATP-binding protein [Phycisphaerales bacterium]|nr:ATP-binding protein [Phycisphaerales bacterium]
MKVKLDVQPDHLEDVAKTRPVLGLAELIWNAVDADANTVSVSYERNKLGGIDRVIVADDGHGIDHTDALTSFSRLGGSWKKTKGTSQREKRALHGQEGKGRFKAFCLGNAIVWSSTYKANGAIKRFRIVGQRPALNQFDVTEAVTSLSLGSIPRWNCST